VDGAHSGESFRDAAETVDWVDEGGVAVSTDTVHVELDFEDGFEGGHFEEVIVGVHGDGVADEIDGVDF